LPCVLDSFERFLHDERHNHESPWESACNAFLVRTIRVVGGQSNIFLCTCWLAKGTNLFANFFKPRPAQSHTTIAIPLHKRIVFIRLLNRSEFSSRLSKISQALDAITGIQFRIGGGRLNEWWSLGAV
jgi:hypothetical protein